MEYLCFQHQPQIKTLSVYDKAKFLKQNTARYVKKSELPQGVADLHSDKELEIYGRRCFEKAWYLGRSAVPLSD